MNALDFVLAQIPVLVVGLIWLRSTIVDFREINQAWERYYDAIERLREAETLLARHCQKKCQ